eukprot:TRINITY_DN44145_c0_g1_i1.p1 TRINITY_DN44145_c0_g1~~TRINITY_DN44145_c0_g1_i1.p1  ORF type:complete len:177 (-),score=47.49 TRINITY_DN44145_c0_g1_i1:316-846(-)
MSVQAQTTIYPTASSIPGTGSGSTTQHMSQSSQPGGGLVSSLPGGGVTMSTNLGPANSSTITSHIASESQVLDKHRLNELVKEVDPSEQLDEEVEDVLLQIADDFIEQTFSRACAFAKHRKANTVDVRDYQLVLERDWNMWIPGFGQQELRPYKRSAQTESHKQRLAVIKKALKKY